MPGPTGTKSSEENAGKRFYVIAQHAPPPMADDAVTVAVVLLLVALGIATYLETRYLRKKMKNRRVRTAKRDDEMQDNAHNAIITTKAIMSSLDRQGIRSPGAAVEQGRVNGRDVSQATELLETAKTRFDAKDYASALSIAQQSKRAAAGEHINVSIPVPAPPAMATPGGRLCPSCGSSLAPDDMFCRKCGRRLAAAACGSCGARLLSQDAFCPKCGAPVPR